MAFTSMTESVLVQEVQGQSSLMGHPTKDTPGIFVQPKPQPRRDARTENWEDDALMCPIRPVDGEGIHRDCDVFGSRSVSIETSQGKIWESLWSHISGQNLDSDISGIL